MTAPADAASKSITVASDGQPATPRRWRTRHVTRERVEPLWREGRALVEIADVFEVSPEVIRRRLAEWGLREPDRRYRPIPELRDPDWLWSRADRTLADVAAELGCSDSTVCRAYQRHGIPRR